MTVDSTTAWNCFPKTRERTSWIVNKNPHRYYNTGTWTFKKMHTKINVQRKNFILSKNSNRNNYREHCINQIPRTVLSGVGGEEVGADGRGLWRLWGEARGMRKTSAADSVRKKAENDSCTCSMVQGSITRYWIGFNLLFCILLLHKQIKKKIKTCFISWNMFWYWECFWFVIILHWRQ